MLIRAKAKGFKGNIDYLQADVASIPLPDKTCDIVVCYSSFPHFPDKTRTLTEIHRVIRNGGRLFVCHTSSRAEINEIHRQIPVVKHDILPGESEMHNLLVGAGFTDIVVADEGKSYFASATKI